MKSLPEYLLGRFRTDPGNAFRFLDEAQNEHAIPFSVFCQDVRRCAAWLYNLGIRRGTRVGMIAKNSYEYLVCLLGLMSAEAESVLLNVENGWDEIDYEIGAAALSFIIHDGEYAALEEAFFRKHSGILLPIDGFSACSEGMDWPGTAEDDAISVILFTSGTTGRGKGVMLSNRNMLAGIQACEEYDRRYIAETDDALFMTCFPLYHVGGLIDALSWIAAGGSMVINIEKRNIMRDIRALPVTFVSAAPTVMQTMYKYLKRGKREQLGSIRTLLVSAARCDAEYFDLFSSHGVELVELYGLSENTGVGLYNFTRSRYDSLGIPQKGVEAEIRDGEICLRGDTVMSGYLNDPEATAETLQDGWLHTGDLGQMDEEGFVYLTGRKKNLIILSGGENVSPEELEALLYKNRRIKETIVKEDGDRICAEIFCDPDSRDEAYAFVAGLNDTLPFYKRMAVVRFRDEPFPRTATGKIKRT